MGWEKALEMARQGPEPHLSHECSPLVEIRDGLRKKRQGKGGDDLRRDWQGGSWQYVPFLLLARSPKPTHNLAEASLHLHVGLAVFVDVSFAVLTAKPKFVVDLGEGENIWVRFLIPFPFAAATLALRSFFCPGRYARSLTVFP